MNRQSLALQGPCFSQRASKIVRNWVMPLGVLGLGFSSLIASGCSEGSAAEVEPQPQQLEKIGIQLYTLRAELTEDFEGTLREVAALGYDEIEFDGVYGWDPADVKTLLNELEMEPIASHIPYATILTNPEGAIEETLALGAEYMVLAYFPGNLRNTLQEWRGWVDTMNSVGAKCKEAGLQFVYHNHNWEFEEMEGAIPYEIILDGIDRDVVKMEMDLYWLALGGEEPERWFERYPGGYVLSHVKDMADTELQEMVDVGDGMLDFGATFAQAEQSGMKHFFVEHDTTTAAMQTADKSLKYLRQLKF